MEKRKRGVLAEGEVTGHAHVVEADVKTRADGVREFSLTKEGVVRHEEHGPVVLSPGDKTADQVREYDADEEEARKVAD